MSEIGRCRLCDEMSPLRISHLVPKFVFDWTKTEGKGLRNMASPNLAIQDGIKRPMLCSACEQRLGRWESQVAARIFVPLNREGVSQHRYGTWLLPFAVSVSFRILAHFRETGVGFINGPCRPYPDEFVAETDAALTAWKRFLLGQSESVGSFEQHMFPLNDVPAATHLQRAIKGYIRIGIDAVAPWPAPDGGVFVVAKLCRLVCVGTIRKGASTWRYTKIHANGGAFGGTFKVADWIPQYLNDLAAARHVAVGRTSERQRELILRKVLGQLPHHRDV